MCQFAGPQTSAIEDAEAIEGLSDIELLNLGYQSVQDFQNFAVQSSLDEFLIPGKTVEEMTQIWQDNHQQEVEALQAQGHSEHEALWVKSLSSYNPGSGTAGDELRYIANQGNASFFQLPSATTVVDDVFENFGGQRYTLSSSHSILDPNVDDFIEGASELRDIFNENPYGVEFATAAGALNNTQLPGGDVIVPFNPLTGRFFIVSPDPEGEFSFIDSTQDGVTQTHFIRPFSFSGDNTPDSNPNFEGLEAPAPKEVEKPAPVGGDIVEQPGQQINLGIPRRGATAPSSSLSIPRG
jgi:hypothetical protein